MILRIGTRGSKLALAQSTWVKQEIETRHAHVRVEVIKIKTTGDKILDSPLSKIGGKGLFVKEIEEALLRNEIDLAVHSMKDVPAELPDDLMLSAFPEREDPRDALITSEGQNFDQLPPGSSVGTSSLRRGAQILHLRPDLNLSSLRGNIDTRLKKLESGDLQAIVLAAAGLRRLGLADRISHLLPVKQVLPAIGQGALGLEVRCVDKDTINLLDFMNHEATQVTVRAERSFLKKLEGGCQVPIAAYASLNSEGIRLQGMVAELDGTRLVREEITGKTDAAEEIGINLAERLLESGAGDMLSRVYGKAIENGAE